MIIVYGIANCDSIKRARAWLDAAGFGYQFHDYKKAGVDRSHLAVWVDRLGWETVLNRAGTTFRNLPEEEKVGMTSDRATEAMLAQPSMIKRPIIEYDGRVLSGFNDRAYAEFFQIDGSR